MLLRDGRALPADMLLVCAGITPNVELAAEAGLEVGRGVLVDDRMRTSDHAIFAAGDVAEHRGRVHGLWPAAVEQAEVAACGALGEEKAYAGTVPVTILKVVGIELTSMGRFEPEGPREEVIALEDESEGRYRKLVIADGRIVGAILLGYSRRGVAGGHRGQARLRRERAAAGAARGALGRARRAERRAPRWCPPRRPIRAPARA